MSGFFYKVFGGKSEKVASRLMKPFQAQVADNCRFRSGNLESILSPSASVATLFKTGAKKSIYLFEGVTWFEWLEDVDVVRAPVAKSDASRTYWTGEDRPRYTENSVATTGGAPFPSISYWMGVPAPSAAPNVVTVGDLDDDAEASVKTRNYVYTFVTQLGEEGPPSPPSASVEVGDGQSADLSGMEQVPGGGNSYNTANMTIRIYRTNTGTNAASFQFVTEIAAGLYSDTKESDELGAVLVTTAYAPPDPDMVGLVAMPNGILAGFNGQDIFFSEPYLPYAWNPTYALVTDYDVVAMTVAGESLLVTTTGNPYVITGNHPSAMSMRKLETLQACVSKNSMVDMGAFALYASPDGLVRLSTGSIDIVTKSIFTREQWQALTPSTMSGHYYDGLYLGTYNNGTQNSFLFTPLESAGDFTDTTSTHDGGYTDLETDTLYLIFGDDVKKFNDDETSPLLLTWRGKTEVAKSLLNYGAAQILADSYPVQIDVYADGVLQHSESINDAEPIRLPSGFLAREWEVEVSAQGPIIQEILVTETISELRKA